MHSPRQEGQRQLELTSTGTVSVVAEIDLDQLIGTEENPQFMYHWNHYLYTQLSVHVKDSERLGLSLVQQGD